MSTPLSPTKLFQCDACGATLPLDATQIGKKCRCGRCGKILVVPGFEAEEDFSAAPRADSVPETVGFYCRVCDTRLVAHTKDVGKQAKCPDCGAKNVVPPPPKTRPKRPPRAMHGEQYGVWGVDEAPLPSEMSSRQPKFYPVYCRVCDTLMQAHAKQVGTNLTCPDCGAKTVAPPPPREIARPSVLVPEGEEYQLDETHVPPERPVYVPHKVRELTELERREEQLRQELQERPELPKVPLLEGVMRMLCRSPLPQCIFVLAFALALEVWFIANAMANVTGMALMIVLVAYGTTVFFGSLSLMAASAYWLAVLKESSEGNDRLHEPPGPVFVDWAGEFFYVVFAGSFAAAPGLLAWRFIPNLPWWAGPAAAAAGWLLLFPLFLLSQLTNGSSLEIFSPKLAGTLFKCPGPWFLFYAESIVLVGGCAAAIVGLQLLSPALIVVSVLVASTGSFLYFRLLGRLAWWLAELMPAEESNLEDQEK